MGVFADLISSHVPYTTAHAPNSVTPRVRLGDVRISEVRWGGPTRQSPVAPCDASGNRRVTRASRIETQLGCVHGTDVLIARAVSLSGIQLTQPSRDYRTPDASESSARFP